MVAFSIFGALARPFRALYACGEIAFFRANDRMAAGLLASLHHNPSSAKCWELGKPRTCVFACPQRCIHQSSHSGGSLCGPAAGLSRAHGGLLPSREQV